MKRLSFLLLLVIILVVFRQWFSFQIISAGDYPFLFKENLDERFSLPLAWSKGYQAPFLNSYPMTFLTGFLSKLGLDFVLIERLAWFWLFLVLAPLSSWYLAKTLFPKKEMVHFFASLIYLFNTYSIMVISGGQVGVALAYANAPLVLTLFAKSIKENNLQSKIYSGLILALQVVFDPRVALITMGAIFLYAIFQTGLAIKKYFELLVLPLFIALGIHLYWLLPTILIRRAVLPPGYGKVDWVSFLSFADFSNSISLLHPNWPENIFGKTYFMRPEFLFLPILAYISLLFINELKSSRVKKNILFFAFLALVGAFLAKGAKPPFGGVYLWLFNHVPGMNLFRDPTKFYVLVAMSYSILILFSLEKISTRVSSIKCKVSGIKILNTYFLILTSFLVYWLFLIQPAWKGQLSGTFQTRELPAEYQGLKDFISSQEKFFRTFWIPQRQRFGFYGNNHPAISAESFVTDSICQEPFCSLKTKMSGEWGQECFPNDRCYVRELSYFLNPKTAETLSLIAVKYIIVPFDSEGEIFLAERKFNRQQREKVEEFLDTIPWLKKIDVADKITVYETPGYKNHFFIDLLSSSRVNELTSWQMINPTKYFVSVKINQPPATLVFSETYDELWQARIGEKIIQAKEFNSLNSFSIDQTGDLILVIEFVAQKYVYWGGTISLLTLLISFGALVYLKKD